MLKNIANIELQIDDWKSQWLLASETPLEICEEFHCRYGKYLAAVREHAESLQQKEKIESIEQPVEDVVNVN